MDSVLKATNLTLGYLPGKPVCENLFVDVPRGSFTVIIGPNACGKSTLLRALARLMRPEVGQVVLDGKDIHKYPSKQVARQLGLLPQTSVAPAGITVADLVARGRFPHHGLLQQWNRADQLAVEEAMQATNVASIKDRLVDELSGGQRQRVWLALVLAQQTPLLLLDEPTTFLDITHQLEVLNLCRQLHVSGEYTLVAVLHDLNLAFRYADNLIVMKAGEVVAQGEPTKVVTAELISHVYDIDCVCIPDPVTGAPMVVPLDSTAPERIERIAS